MPYATYENVITRYPVLKGWGKTETEVSSDLIYYAEIMLNGMMGTHFSVPFSGSHPTVKDLTIDLAYYKGLMLRDQKKAAEIFDTINGRIEKIKNGEEYIYTGSGTTIVPESSAGEIWSNTKDYYPVHGMLDPIDLDIDPDRLDAEESERS